MRAANGIGMSEPTTLSILSPGERALPLSPGVRVRAVWAQTLAEGAALLGAAERIEWYYNVLYEEDVFLAARLTALLDKYGERLVMEPCMMQSLV